MIRHYRRAAGALLVYDVSNRKTFANATDVWLNDLKESADEENGLLSVISLVGNKVDLAEGAAMQDAFVSEAEHEVLI